MMECSRNDGARGFSVDQLKETTVFQPNALVIFRALVETLVKVVSFKLVKNPLVPRFSLVKISSCTVLTHSIPQRDNHPALEKEKAGEEKGGLLSGSCRSKRRL